MSCFCELLTGGRARNQRAIQRGVPAQDVEIIVVDNADEPEVEAFAREQGFAYLPMDSNVGLSAANNRGAEVATG